MLKLKLLACSLCFLGSTSLQGEERTVAHLFVVDMKNSSLALEGSDQGLHVPSHEVSPASLTDVSIARHTNRVLGLHENDIESKNLHLFGQIECVPQNSEAYLESNDGFLSLTGLRVSDARQSRKTATRKVTHLYYLHVTYSKAQTNNTPQINWRSIPTLFANVGVAGMEQVHPREDLEIAALMAKFKETATLDKKLADIPSLTSHAKNQKLRVETHLSVPASFIAYLYKNCPDAYKAYKEGKEGAEFIQNLVTAPLAVAVGGSLAASACTIQ